MLLCMLPVFSYYFYLTINSTNVMQNNCTIQNATFDFQNNCNNTQLLILSNNETFYVNIACSNINYTINDNMICYKHNNIIYISQNEINEKNVKIYIGFSSSILCLICILLFLVAMVFITINR